MITGSEVSAFNTFDHDCGLLFSKTTKQTHLPIEFIGMYVYAESRDGQCWNLYTPYNLISVKSEYNCRIGKKNIYCNIIPSLCAYCEQLLRRILNKHKYHWRSYEWVKLYLYSPYTCLHGVDRDNFTLTFVTNFDHDNIREIRIKNKNELP